MVLEKRNLLLGDLNSVSNKLDGAHADGALQGTQGLIILQQGQVACLHRRQQLVGTIESRAVEYRHAHLDCEQSHGHERSLRGAHERSHHHT